tara:strand:- start:257 stop:496 length:240 start_codon:yes stop_codon:yes gene_type:complete
VGRGGDGEDVGGLIVQRDALLVLLHLGLGVEIGDRKVGVDREEHGAVARVDLLVVEALLQRLEDGVALDRVERREIVAH